MRECLDIFVRNMSSTVQQRPRFPAEHQGLSSTQTRAPAHPIVYEFGSFWSTGSTRRGQFDSISCHVFGYRNLADNFVKQIKSVKVVAIRQDDADTKTMRITVDQWKNKLNSGIVMVAGAREGKVTIIAGVSKDLSGQLKAGDLISYLAPMVGGKGGGKAELAQGGGPDTESVDSLIDATYTWVEKSL